MKIEVNLTTQTEIDMGATFMRNLLGLREEAVKDGSVPLRQTSGAASETSREDKGGAKKPPKSASQPSKEQVSTLLKAKLEINQNSVAEALRQFSRDNVAKFSTIPVENYKAFLKTLEAIK